MKTSKQAATSAGRAARFLGGTTGSLRARVFRSSVWVGVASVLQSLLQTGRSIILARLLTPEMFGLMGICMIVIRGLDLFTETGFGAALIQRQERVEEAKHTAFTLQVLRGVVLMVITWIVAPLAAAYYDEPRLTLIVWFLSLAFPLNGLTNINTILLEKRLDFRLVTTLELSVAVLSTGAVIVLAYVMRSAWAIAIGHLILVGSRLTLSYVLVEGRPRFQFDRGVASELFRYGRYITGLTIALFLTTEADNLVVGKQLGFEWLGYYTMAYILANLPATHVAKVASRVLFPAYSALQGDRAKLRAAYVTVLRVVGGLTIPAAVGLALLAPEVTRIVYGERWLPAADALRILAVFGAMRSLSSLGGYVLQAVGRPNINFYMVAGKLVVILALLPWLTARYGIVGAATAVTIPQVVADCCSFVVVQRLIELQFAILARVLGRIAVASSIMGGVVYAARLQMTHVGAFELVALVALGGVVYATLTLSEMRGLYAEHLKPALAARAR